MSAILKIPQVKWFLIVGFGILGVWLIYWDLTDALNAWLHANGIPPYVAGFFIIALASYLGYEAWK